MKQIPIEISFLKVVPEDTKTKRGAEKRPEDTDIIEVHARNKLLQLGNKSKAILFRTYGWFDYLMIVTHPRSRCTILHSHNRDAEENYAGIMKTSFIGWYYEKYPRELEDSTRYYKKIKNLREKLKDISKDPKEAEGVVWKEKADNMEGYRGSTREPFGYTTEDEKLKKKQEQKYKQAIIDIHNNYQKGKSYTTICNDIKEKYKLDIKPSQLEPILTDPIYAGKVEGSRYSTKVKEQSSESLKFIDDETFKRTQELFSRIICPDGLFVLSFIKLKEHQNTTESKLCNNNEKLSNDKEGILEKFMVIDYLGLWDVVILSKFLKKDEKGRGSYELLEEYKYKFLISTNEILQSSSIVLTPFQWNGRK